MIRWFVILALAAHGIGHILFLVPLLGIADWGQSTRSWLFTDPTGAKLIGSLIWIAAIVIFLVATYALLSQQWWWRNTAVVAAVISSAGLLLFWNFPLSSSARWALLFNGLVLGALLLLQWPGTDLAGA